MTLTMLQIFGSVDMPPGVEKYGILQAGGLISFLSNIIKLISIGAGIFSLVNLVLAPGILMVLLSNKISSLSSFF